MTSPSGLDVLTIGETMGALRATGPIRLGSAMTLSAAGAESTVAIGLVRLGHRAGWVGRVGDDEMGELVLRTLRAEGVDLTYARVDPDGRPTGLMTREHRVGSVIRVSYHRAGSAGSAIEPGDVLAALDGGTRVLHLTGITPALSLSAAEAVLAAARRARDLGVIVSFDVNYRSRLWSAERARDVLLPLAELADVLIASSDELHLVALASSRDSAVDEATAVAAILAGGTREVVVTRGGDGASVTTADGTVSVPAHRVPVVDVVGAGDAFVAGYLSGLLDGLPVERRLERATATGAFSVATAGDWEGLPTRADLALLDQPAGTTVR
jgi:2-dehydro-3-deoxygluconokinase